MIISKVISGGQTGVDVAALRAAKALGLSTGGWMPKGWITLEGPRPEYADEFGMREHTSSDYSPRTRANVEEADFTLRIAQQFGSTGERCTLGAINRFKKPHADIWLPAVTLPVSVGTDYDDAIGTLKRFFVEREGRPFVLNVAGNSEKTAPGIGQVAQKLITWLLQNICEGRS